MDQAVKYVSFQNDLAEAFREELRDYKKSTEIYRSLCNTIWKKDGEEFAYSWRAAGGLVSALRNDLDLPLMDPDICQNCAKNKKDHIEKKEKFKPFFAEKEIEFTYSFCDQSEETVFTEGYSRKEDYMDFYCSGKEGEVPLWVEKRMNSVGYTVK